MISSIAKLDIVPTVSPPGGSESQRHMHKSLVRFRQGSQFFRFSWSCIIFFSLEEPTALSDLDSGLVLTEQVYRLLYVYKHLVHPLHVTSVRHDNKERTE